MSVGQDKPIISPREPTSLAQVGFRRLRAPGNLWDWDPQVRLEQRFSFGDEDGVAWHRRAFIRQRRLSGPLPPQYAGTLGHSASRHRQGRVEFFHEGRRGRGESDVAWKSRRAYSGGTTHVAGTSVESEVASIDWLLRPESMAGVYGRSFPWAGCGRAWLAAGLQHS